MTTTREPRKKKASNRSRRKEAARKQGQRRKLFLIGGAVGVAALIALTLILASRESSLPDLVAAAELDASIPSDGRTLGDPQAPIHLIEYGDYQCPRAAVEQQAFRYCW